MSMRIARLLLAISVAVVLMLSLVGPAYADRCTGKGKSDNACKEIPEVPVVALYPFAATLITAGFAWWIIRRNGGESPADV